MPVRERTTTKPVTWKRRALRWLPTFFGFPLGGFVAERKLKRAAEDEVIASRARREGKVNA